MVLCFAADCSHKNHVDSCRFFRFPTDVKEFRQWKDVSRRADGAEPNKNLRLCSCHFPSGLRENGPLVFKRNETKAMTYTSPEKHLRKRNHDTFDQSVAATTKLYATAPQAVKTAMATATLASTQSPDSNMCLSIGSPVISSCALFQLQ